nr:MAG TPA: hypothetical protein [Caudoviricetes sp.]
MQPNKLIDRTDRYNKHDSRKLSMFLNRSVQVICLCCKLSQNVNLQIFI